MTFLIILKNLKCNFFQLFKINEEHSISSSLMMVLSCQTGLHFWLNPKTKQKDQGSKPYADGCPRFIALPGKELVRSMG